MNRWINRAALARMMCWTAALTAGGMLFQTTGCTDVAIGLTTAASLVTAGGVVYIVSRILND